MSRCFPFPPPGYEKKHSSDYAGLLKEEKHKEKKHKKEKKDKEKGEGKEKKDKDRREGKHREKKERKDKHKDKKEKRRDKKRDKESKSKEKDKKSVCEEPTAVGHPGVSSAEPGKNAFISEEKTDTALFQVQHGRKDIQGSDLAKEEDELKFVQELCRRIRDEENGKGIQLAGRFSGEGRKDERVDRFGVKVSRSLAEDMGTNRRMDVEATRNESRFNGNAVANNFTVASKRKIEGVPRTGSNDPWIFAENKGSENAILPNITEFSKSKLEGKLRPLEENKERKEEKEKTKGRGDEKLGDKSKDKDRDKKRHKKSKHQEKDKHKEKKSKEKSKHNGLQDVNRNDFIAVSHNRISELPRDSNDGAALDANLKKRKLVPNGSLHENEARPAKIPRPASHEPTQNGNKVETLQVSLNSSRPNAPELNKEQRINGAVHGQPFPIPRPNPSLSTTGVGQTPEPYKKLPQADQIPETSRKLACADRFAETSRKPPCADQIPETYRKLPCADQFAETSRKPPCADQFAETSRKPPCADQFAETSRKPPCADQFAETSRKPPPCADHQVASTSRKPPCADQLAKPPHPNLVVEASKKPPHPNLVVEASKKPPHPDSKYLSQILTVPKMEEWIEFDDTEWLVGSRNPPDRKPVVGSNGVNEVWSEARYVESTDIYALPYVIPY